MSLWWRHKRISWQHFQAKAAGYEADYGDGNERKRLVARGCLKGKSVEALVPHNVAACVEGFQRRQLARYKKRVRDVLGDLLGTTIGGG